MLSLKTIFYRLPGIQAETKKSLSRGLIEMEGITFAPLPFSFSLLGTQTPWLELQQPSCVLEDRSHMPRMAKAESENSPLYQP